MPGPRLIKVACPECGAALRVDTGIEVVTCAYCRKSSFVHWPDRPARPAATMPEYGNIHVPAHALRSVSALMIVMVVAPIGFFVVLGVVISIVTAAPGRISPLSSPPARMSKPGGPACERAVACCKAMQPTNAGCDGFRLMSEADCKEPANNLAQTAKSMGKSCP